MLMIILIIALAIGLFYGILQLDISGTYKFLLVCAEMIIISQAFIRAYKFPSELGFVLIKSRKGIELIDRLSKNKEAFHFMTELGNVMAYGLSSRLFLKNGSARSLVLGLVLLCFISFFVAPTAFEFLIKIIKIGSVEKSVSSLAGDSAIYLYAMLAVLVGGGLFLFVLLGILLYGGIILNGIIQQVFFGVEAMKDIGPGGTFLLPGVNLPLFEGILALIVVLVVHEGAHAILTRIAKVPLLSSGIALFGIIPIGAFVEPDEEKLAKAQREKQTRVMIAGPTSNLIASVVFFVLFFAAVFLINGVDALQAGPAASAARFIYVTLGLIFALNFVVGVVNLLPLPLFDGFRVIDINVENKMIVKSLMYITLFFFIVNFLPWFFR